ncbi:MAG: dihydropyrimidinase [Pseudomonadota bacterium]
MTQELVIKGGMVATAEAVFMADIAVSSGKIAAIGDGLVGAEVIDATGKLVLPGGIESHCHLAQESSTGMMTADGYESGSISAAFGGNTTIIPFAAQLKGQPISAVLPTYDARAATSVLDYGYHLIVSDTSVPNFREDMLAVFDRGVTSFKVFLTYDIRLSDDQLLDVLEIGRDAGALTMVHAENNAMIDRLRAEYGAEGKLTPPYHTLSRPEQAEAEAISRAIRLARFAGAPLFIVHVSSVDGLAEIAAARAKGQALHAETCPQYLFLTDEALSRPEGGKYICSPPLRSATTQAALWQGLQTGVLDMSSSDHAPYRYDETGKLANGGDDFRKIANGMPGIELRLPLMFQAVHDGRLTLQQFVAMISSNAARIFGLQGRKGTIAPGADADLAIWDPNLSWTVKHGDMHDAMDYTPFEGKELTGKPETMIQRGHIIVADGQLVAAPGDGDFLHRARFGGGNGADPGDQSEF